MMMKFNKYHLVSQSPWPFMSSLSVQNMMVQTIMFTQGSTTPPLITMTNMLSMVMIPMVWWKNTSSEASKKGEHQKKVMNLLKMGMMMFIMSEILFFSSFFWGYFHMGSSPNIELGQKWPPNLITPFNPVNVPLLNTSILIASGFSITMSHHFLQEKKYNMSKKSLMMTCALGMYFTVLQWMEYDQAMFSMADSSYGTIFFIATGFHGIHVLMGTMFLTINLFMMMKKMTSHNHHTGFEMAAWYWHFVDVVWLMLYLSIYWWGK